jgi:hypothetical protein
MRLMIAMMLAATCIGCGSAKKNADDPTKQKTGEWIDMLAVAENWHVYNKPGIIGKAWSLNNGVLHLDGSNRLNGRIVDGGNLVYNQDFENFHLKLEWKISPGGNSGIMFFVKEDPALNEPYQTGPEMQVLDNNAHPDAKIIKHRAGDLYDLISCSKEVVKPVGEWNLAEIVVNNAKLEFFLNGEMVVSTTLWDDNWNKMIEGSKFKGWPQFAKFKSGKIVLQDHNDEVWFRNMMVKKL